MDFSQRLLSWYAKNKRMLPWRESKDPYKIWLSEVILQQTRVGQGLAYYQHFIAVFPDVFALATAPEEKVLRMWQGLGYYSRARNLLSSARIIAFKRGGKFPQSASEWLSLKGVGPYTAAAIASIASGEVIAAIDGNVLRVLSRLFAIGASVDTPEGKGVVQEIAGELIDVREPGAFNQAIMDFGSQICRPSKPLCEQCMFNRECLAFLRKEVYKYPVKSKKKEVRPRYFHYLFIYFHDDNKQLKICVQQRKHDDIWKHLFEWPLIETSKPDKDICQLLATTQPHGCSFIADSLQYTGKSFKLKHQLTHQTIHASFCLFYIDSSHEREMQKWYSLVTPDEFERMAKPRLLEIAMETISRSLSI